MEANNSLAKVNEKNTNVLSNYLALPKVQDQLRTIFSNETECLKFTTSLVSAVSVNPQLASCTNASIVSAGLLANSLSLSLSPQLGFAYAVPFEQKEKKDKNGEIIERACTKAVFVLGYKGYLQLAIRSGLYADIDVMEIKEGEYLGRDSETGKVKFRFISDDDERDRRKTVGYMAYFVLTNGYKKTLYWTKEKMLKHADQYSPAFSYYGTNTGKYPKVSYDDYLAGKYPKNTEWLYSSFWYKNFTDMAYKTMLRQLISKHGVMSIEMQTGFGNDNDYDDEITAKTGFTANTDSFTEETAKLPPAPKFEPDIDEDGVVRTKAKEEKVYVEPKVETPKAEDYVDTTDVDNDFDLPFNIEPTPPEENDDGQFDFFGK